MRKSLVLIALVLTLAFVPGIAASQPNEFRLSFTFKRGNEDDLDRINEVLSKLPLSRIEIVLTDKGYDDYLMSAKRYSKDDVLIETTYTHGFDSIELLCTMDSSKESHYYKIESAAFSYEEAMEFEKFSAKWDREHPDRERQLLTEIDFPDSKANAFVIVHYARKAD